MRSVKHKWSSRLFLAGVVLFMATVACNISRVIEDTPLQLTATQAQPEITVTPASTQSTPSLLTICMGQEPGSLFLYADDSLAARSVRQAIYDGPFDTLGFVQKPVLLQEMPTLENGGARFEPVTVQISNIIVDRKGNLNKLSAGVEYRPAGCEDSACVVAYNGQGNVQMDQMVVRFRLIPGILWSDGAPLTADDSHYSFELAQALYPRARADLINRTQSYQALDEVTLEWRGVPGYRPSGYAANFFTPLPRHAWGSTTPEELLLSGLANRQPVGWGAYVIEEWRSGDHISLTRNPNYFVNSVSAATMLPYFDRLVFRFMTDQTQAVNAFLAGECDYLDETVALDPMDASLRELQKSGQISLYVASGNAWEHLDFGIMPYDDVQRADVALPLFRSVATRQAVAMCIDRQRLNSELFQGLSQIPDSYVPAGHPLSSPEVTQYSFDPQAAGNLLDAAGWLDEDGNPQTPRQARGVEGIPDGTAFEFDLLTTTEAEKQRAAQIIQESLAQCGIRMQIDSRPWEQVFASGPAGPLFGRNFALAQFAWVTASQPPCFLYTTAEIPGPYPDYPQGWGGANASGYSNPEFDRLCQDAQVALPGTAAYQQAHFLAQALFTQELPSLPVYLRLKMVAAQPSLCGVELDPSAESALWNLENFASAENCR